MYTACSSPSSKLAQQGGDRAGYAMLMLMLVAAIMAVIGIGLFQSIRIEADESSAMDAYAQADLLASSGIEYAIDSLKNDPSTRGSLPLLDLSSLVSNDFNNATLDVRISESLPNLVIDATATVNNTTAQRQWTVEP